MGYKLLKNGKHWGYNPLILTFDPSTSNGTSKCDHTPIDPRGRGQELPFRQTHHALSKLLSLRGGGVLVSNIKWIHPPKTNMTLNNPHVQRKYIFIHACFSIVILVFGGVVLQKWVPNFFSPSKNNGVLLT